MRTALSSRDQRHDAVAAAARRLFARQAPQSVGLDHLATAAGVERTWVYRRYGNRHDLFKTVALEWLALLGEACGDAPVDGGVHKYLERQTDILSDALAAPAIVDLTRAVFINAAGTPWLAQTYRRRLRALAGTIAERIRRAGAALDLPLAVPAEAVDAYLFEIIARVTYPRLWRDDADPSADRDWRGACVARLMRAVHALEHYGLAGEAASARQAA